MKMMMKTLALLIAIGLVSACDGSKKAVARKNLEEAQKAAIKAASDAEAARTAAGNDPELIRQAAEAANRKAVEAAK